VEIDYCQGHDLPGKPGKPGKLTAVRQSQKIDQKLGKCWAKFCQRKMFFATFTIGAAPVFSSVMHACFYTVK